MPTEDHHIERKEKRMIPKYEKVCAEIAKIEKKVEDLQEQLKELRLSLIHISEPTRRS